MAGLFGGMRQAFSKWNAPDANGLTGMQRIGNVGSSLQGQAPMFPSQGQQGQQGEQPAMGLADKLSLFGAQLQDMGGGNQAPPPPPIMSHQSVPTPSLGNAGGSQDTLAMLRRIYGGR